MKKWANDVSKTRQADWYIVLPARLWFTPLSTRPTGKTRKGDRQTSSERTHSSYSHQFRVHRANGESVESATIDNILEVYYLWAYQVTVCLRVITLLLWHWLGDAELYDSPVTAGTLSHAQKINQLNSFAGQNTKTMKPGRLCLSIFCQYITHGSARTSAPFPHFPFPHFPFLLLDQPVRCGWMRAETPEVSINLWCLQSS